MANEEHVEIIRQGAEAWNQWRGSNPEVIPDLSGAALGEAKLRHADLHDANLSEINLAEADLRQARLGGANLTNATLTDSNLMWADFRHANLYQADLTSAALREACLSQADLREAKLPSADLEETDLSGADLRRADLRRADLREADLREADLREADLGEAYLYGAYLSGANLRKAVLSGANLSEADLSQTDLSGADLRMSVLVGTNLHGATLVECPIHGVSAWRVDLSEAEQRDLVVSDYGEPTITVDNLEVAQFIYLLLNNEKVRDVIDTITSKAVLILGRFNEERKAVLDAIREELGKQDYLPIMFDFDKPASKDVTGTVETLARMARFIIADLTDPSSVPHELATIVPFLRTTPVLPIRLAGTGGYSMFADYQRAYRWVLATHEYDDSRTLISTLPQIIARADELADTLRNQNHLAGD